MKGDGEDSLSDVLNAIRAHYLEALHASILEFKQTYNPAAAEVLLAMDRDTAYAFRLYRMDMAAQAGGEPVLRECNLSSYLNFSPQSFTPAPGLSLTLSPIAWNGVDVSIDQEFRDDRLEQWALRWLDVDDEHAHDERGFQSVIHSVTEPTTAHGRTTFSVDFGSAPYAAVADLLQLLAEAGVTRVALTSDWML